MKKNLCIILAIFFVITSCGRKGDLENLPDEKRPNFENVIWKE